MTTPMSLQPWWWQIFILIQLWPQFFQMFVYGDIVYAQTWYWPWKTVPSHIHMPRRPMLFEYGPHFLFDSFVKIWATCQIFLGKWFAAPLAKNFPYACVFSLELVILISVTPITLKWIPNSCKQWVPTFSRLRLRRLILLWKIGWYQRQYSN